MINSVGEHAAGQDVDLDDEQAIRFIVLGYADGELPREVGDGERAEIEQSNQGVSLGG